MQIGLLETDGTGVWQPRFAALVDCRTGLSASPLRYLASRETLAALERELLNFPARVVFPDSSDFHYLTPRPPRGKSVSLPGFALRRP